LSGWTAAALRGNRGLREISDALGERGDGRVLVVGILVAGAVVVDEVESFVAAVVAISVEPLQALSSHVMCAWMSAAG